MNKNHPDFKKIQKISRYFNVKPKVFDWNLEKNVGFIRSYNKKRDIPNLTYVAGVACENALKLYELKFKRIEDNVFRSGNSIIMVDTDGIVVTQIQLKRNQRKPKRFKHSETGVDVVVCSGEVAGVIISQIKKDLCKCFSLI